MKIAIIEAGHWHAPLYLDGFDAADIEVAAVSDVTSSGGKVIAKRFGACFYTDYKELIARENIDFAFVFGRHVEMPVIAESLIKERIPFSLEKPCGTSLEQVSRLLDLSEKANLYVAVPFIYRVSELVGIIRKLEGGLPSEFTHLSFRFIAGAPQRYEAMGCPWMLDPEQSGGGATANVGVHFLDLFRLLSGQEVTSVSAVMSSATHNTPIEDYAAITLQTKSGTIGLVETGYTYQSQPADQREFSFTARSRCNYYRSSDGGITVHDLTQPSAPARTIPFETENDLFYPVYARHVLNEYRAGHQPHSGLREAHSVMQLLQASYASAAANGNSVVLDLWQNVTLAAGNPGGGGS
jgi:predicted dehydrogenase